MRDFENGSPLGCGVVNEQNKSDPEPYRWVILALLWLLYFAVGLTMRSVAPLVTPILEELNISYSEMGMILGAWPLTYVAAATIAGALIDRWGIRIALFVGIVTVGLSEFLRSFAGGFTTLFLSVAIFGIGGPLLSAGCPKAISLWFSGKERGTAFGIYMTGTWIGGLIAYSTINSVVMPLTGYSWRITFIVYSSPAFAAALLWWLLARDVKSKETAKGRSVVQVFTDLIRVRKVQLILVLGFISLAIGHGVNDWLPKILETGGLSPAIAGFAASIPLVFAIPSVLIILHFTPPSLRDRILGLLALVVAAAVLLIAMASGSLLIIGLVLYGLAFFCAFPLLMLILMDLPEVGSQYMGSAAGMFFCVAELGGFAGPFMIGAVKDLTGSFVVGACLTAGLAGMMSMIAFHLRDIAK